MIIEFERSGGFAGMLISATIDTEALADEEADWLREKLQEVDFFDLPALPAGAASGADQFVYKVTVRTEERQHTVELGDRSASDELQSLLRRLTVLARSVKR